MPVPFWNSVKGMAMEIASITSELQCCLLAFSASPLTDHWQRARLGQCLQGLLPNVHSDNFYPVFLSIAPT